MKLWKSICCLLLLSLAEEMEKYQLNYLQTCGNIKDHEKTVHENIFLGDNEWN